MQNILVLSSSSKGDGPGDILHALRAARYRVACTSLDFAGTDPFRAIGDEFSGRPPDILIADLSAAGDCLPLRHATRLLRQTWGEDAPAALCLALLTSRHLHLPDWVAFVDDFLLPPYVPTEVLARIALLLFRRRHVRFGDTLTFADVLIDLNGKRALDADGRVLSLTPREYDLLQFLLMHRGKFFARDRLLDLVWGLDFDGGERTVDIHVTRLRAKLPPSAAALLDTRRGVGYGFVLGHP